MEHEHTKFRGTHNNSNQREIIFLGNHTKVPISSSSSTATNYLQEFHHLDYHLHHHSSHQVYGRDNWTSLTSSPAAFGSQTPCFDSFSNFPCGGYSSSNFDFYECKPLIEDGSSNNGGHGLVMDNFHSSNCDEMMNGDVDMMGSDNRRRQLSQTVAPMMSFQEAMPVNFVVPDEVSCVNMDNNDIDCEKTITNGNNNNHKNSRRMLLKGGKRSNVVKGQWTIEEDRLLIRLVEQYGIRKWSHIAQMLPGRIGKQCRERWHNHLRPDIKKDTWSEEEDKALIEAHVEIGNKWAEIAKRLPGRTENSIKNHWNATKRRQFSKRKCRSKYPRASILQEYIKSLNLDNSNSSNLVKNQSEGGTTTVNNNNNNSFVITDRETNDHKLDAGNNNNNGNDTLGENDRLVPDFDFNDVPDFEFDDTMFQESCCSMDSLMDEMNCAPPAVDERGFGKESTLCPLTMVEPQVKKELDLVEMISQANL